MHLDCMTQQRKQLKHGIGGTVMDCFNHDCPFRVNEASSCNRCDCVACPNRSTIPYSICSNRTLTNEELVELERIKGGAD